jgi:hypothetical protein
MVADHFWISLNVFMINNRLKCLTVHAQDTWFHKTDSTKCLYPDNYAKCSYLILPVYKKDE